MPSLAAASLAISSGARWAAAVRSAGSAPAMVQASGSPGRLATSCV